MSGLFGSLSVSLRALLAQQAAVETTGENIANVNTPGYARRRVEMQEDVTWSPSRLEPGRGVQIASIESLRDRVLELRILAEQQQQSRNEKFVQSMQPLELLFGSSEAGVADALQKFFDSLQQLSATPADAALRSEVLTSAESVAESFRSAAAEISTMRLHLETSVSDSVQEVNRLTKEIAAVNAQVAGKQRLGLDAGALEDRRGVLLGQLSQQLDFSCINDANGLSITTSTGVPLVVAGESFALEQSVGAMGPTHISGVNGADITSDINGGNLGGLLAVRDQELVSVGGQLDQLAEAFVNRINEVHRSGYDLAANPGGDFFVAPSASLGAAAGMQVAVKDPTKIAASGDGQVGDNATLRALLDIGDAALINGRSPLQSFTGIVFFIGSEIANAKSEADTNGLLLRQLENQRGAISGVSLDEEAANLLRFERAYQAAARVVSITNDLLDTVINLGRS